jgi:hypothetical protein
LTIVGWIEVATAERGFLAATRFELHFSITPADGHLKTLQPERKGGFGTPVHSGYDSANWLTGSQSCITNMVQNAVPEPEIHEARYLGDEPWGNILRFSPAEVSTQTPVDHRFGMIGTGDGHLA